MKCPKCKKGLIIKRYSQYQDLVEHCIDPNGNPSLKPEYHCPKNCYGRLVFWDNCGDVYNPPSLFKRLMWKLNIYNFPKSNYDIPNIRKEGLFDKTSLAKKLALEKGTKIHKSLENKI